MEPAGVVELAGVVLSAKAKQLNAKMETVHNIAAAFSRIDTFFRRVLCVTHIARKKTQYNVRNTVLISAGRVLLPFFLLGFGF